MPNLRPEKVEEEPETVEETVNMILEDVERKTCLVAGTHWGICPLDYFRAAINAAKESENAPLLSSVYDRVIKYHKTRQYYYDAALIAVEAGRKDVVEDMLIKMASGKNPNFEGAAEICGKIGDNYRKKMFLKKGIDRLVGLKWYNNAAQLADKLDMKDLAEELREKELAEREAYKNNSIKSIPLYPHS